MADADASTPARDDTVRLRAAADTLSEATLLLEDVDLNPLLDDDVRTLLDAKDDLSDICLRLRRHHHTLEEDRDG